MAKECPECHTMAADDAAYCNACIYEFSSIPPARLSQTNIRKLAAIIVVVAAVIVLVLFFQAGR